MVDDEGTDGGELGEGVRPSLGREALGELFQHVMASVVAERHEERSEEGLALGAATQARGEAARRVYEGVVATAGTQRALELRERRLALRTAMARERDGAVRARGQRLVEGNGDCGEVLLARQQRGREPNLLKAGGRRTDRCRSLALKPSVNDVRRCDKDTPCTTCPQIGKRLRKRHAHGATARAGAHHDACVHGGRELAHERGDARVPLLAGEAAGYDQRVHLPTSEMIQKGSVPF